MDIVNVRIDERLVHGMVATYWIPSLGLNRVVCIDEEAANNSMKKSGLRMATPSNIFLSVISLEKAIDNFKNNKYESESIMIITKNPHKLIKLYEAGIHFNQIIVGNLGVIDKKKNAKEITKYINVTESDIKDFEWFHEKKVELVDQLIPDYTPVDFYKEMKGKVD